MSAYWLPAKISHVVMAMGVVATSISLGVMSVVHNVTFSNPVWLIACVGVSAISLSAYKIAVTENSIAVSSAGAVK